MVTKQRRVPAGALITVLAAILLAVLSPGAGSYRAIAYPTEGSNLQGSGRSGQVEDPGKFLARALTRATLFTSFDGPAVTEGVKTRFVATVTYDRPAPGGRVIKVAYANDATLSAAQGAFDIVPVTDRRQNLDEGTKRPGGGFQLQWIWQVTPRQSGSLTLMLEIQPVLLLETTRSDLEVRNKPIPVDVKVHPNRIALQMMKKDARGLELAVPDRWTVDRTMHLTAALPLSSDPEVGADLLLVPAPGSAPVTVRASVDREGGQLVGRWSVTPTSTGSVQLQLTTTLQTEAGVIPITDTVTTTRSFSVDPQPPSFWQRVQTPFLWLTPVLGVLVVLIPWFRSGLSRTRRSARSDGSRGPQDEQAGQGGPAN